MLLLLFAVMGSKGRKCQLVHSRAFCSLARDGSGRPIVLSKACKKCTEWRCRTHCECGRKNSAKGRRAARPGKLVAPKAKAQAKPPAQPQPQAKAKAAAASQFCNKVEVLDENSWRDRLVKDIKESTEVQMAVMILDDPALCSVLKVCLRSVPDFKCSIVVDKKQYLDKVSKYQRPRLKELQTKGAKIKLASGHRSGKYQGLMHRKIAVLDGKVAFTGSCNFTFAAGTHREDCLRLEGPCVAQLQSHVLEAQKSGHLLDDA